MCDDSRAQRLDGCAHGVCPLAFVDVTAIATALGMVGAHERGVEDERERFFVDEQAAVVGCRVFGLVEHGVTDFRVH